MENRIQEAFDQVSASDQIKENTLQFLASKRHQNHAISWARPQRMIVIATCCLLCLLFGMKGLSIMRTPVSYVSIDVNPSVELALNTFGRVVSVTPYNKDGEKIIKGLSLKGTYYTKAIDQIVENEAMNHYLTEDADLVFTVAADDKSKETEMLTQIDNCVSCKNHHGQSIGTNIEIKKEAHENGFSLGKYYAYLQLQQYDDTITAEQCKHMSMAEIHSLTQQHENGCVENSITNDSGSKDSCKHNGNGHHHGQ